MFRTLTNLLLGQTRFRRVMRLGLAGVLIAATGFGLSQMPSLSGDANAEEESDVVTTDTSATTDAKLQPIPGADPNQAGAAQGAVNPYATTAAAPVGLGQPADNPYRQAQYTDSGAPISDASAAAPTARCPLANSWRRVSRRAYSCTGSMAS